MKIWLYFVCFIFAVQVYPQAFKKSQSRYPRVKNAYTNKYAYVDSLFKSKGINLSNCKVFIRGFKFEEILEVWAKNPKDTVFTHIKDYQFCASSGTLGPKRKQGDGQIPEGVYYLDKYNAWSNYHLALGINYPNKSDIILGDKTDPGNQIYIHGKCCTIGCIPLTDDKIEELYVICVEAKNGGQTNIPVYLFPFRFTDERMKAVHNKYSEDSELVKFWDNLRDIYNYFEKNKIVCKVTVDSKGKYISNPETILY